MKGAHSEYEETAEVGAVAHVVNHIDLGTGWQRR